MFGLFKKEISDYNSINNISLNFENDIKPVLYLINLEITNLKFTIEASNKKILTDHDILIYSQEILLSLNATLSTEFRKRILTRYINYDKQNTFFTKIIVKYIVDIALEKNKMK